MRYIYMDEAGTSAKEPVTVVVGIMIEPDSQYRLAESKLSELVSTIPKEFQENFISHATAIWSNPKYRAIWTQTARLHFLKSLMGLPKMFGMPIALGIARRTSFVPEDVLVRMSAAQFQHLMAFLHCVSKADKYLRNHTNSEIGVIIAEDVPQIKRFFTPILNLLRNSPLVLPSNDTYFRPTQEEQKTGIITQDGVFQVSHIKDGVHFTEKANSPLLQIADACAFGFRRYFAQHSEGEEFVEAMGIKLIREEWDGPTSASLFYP